MNQVINLAELKSHPKNYNAHSPAQVARIAKSLSTFGQVRSIVCWHGTILAGHGVVQAAHTLGWDTIRADVVDELSEDEALAYVVADNELARQSDPDQAQLAAILEELQAREPLLVEAAGYSAQELEQLLRLVRPQEPVDAEPQIDRASELQAQWGTATGQLWQLGEHRLICGDCTDAGVVARVMGGERAEMVWTDPPYGVAVGDKNKYLNSIAPSNRIEENLENDTLDEPALVRMLDAAFDGALDVCLAGGAWYVAAPPGPLHVLFGQLLKDRGIWHQTIQWVKNNATFSPMGVDYHWQSEPIFYGWKPGAGHRYYGGRQQTTVWEIDRPLASPEHPTMKPVELVARAVENSSCSNDLVYDPFAGSGTTGIACHNLGRRARMVEISEGYCAVILERFAQIGVQPALLEAAPQLEGA